MNPFVAPQTALKPSPWSWLGARSGLVVFLLTLALGLGAVGWRANARAEAARRVARLEEDRTRAAWVRGQLRHAVAALQVLGALARQSGGAVPKFQEVGADLRAAWPDLATLELQPNGIVSDIVPRAGYERVIGSDVRKDPAQIASARAAVQRRAPTVAGPLRLYHGEPGIVMRAPIFQWGRDGREAFWGFVAVSMRWPQPLGRVQTEELQQAMQQELAAQEFKLGATPAPPGGSFEKSKAALEGLGVLLVAGLLWLLMRLLNSGHTLEAALAEANRRLAGVGAERRQTQEDWRAAKEAAAAAQTQLKQARAALQQAESRGLECQARLEASERANQETSQALRARLAQAELNAQELQERLDATARAADTAARAAQAELEEARAALRQAQAAHTDLQSRPGAVPSALEQSAQDPAPAAALPAPETVAPLTEADKTPPPKAAVAPPAADGPEENPPPPRAPEPPPEKPKAGPEARRKKSRREAEPELFSSKEGTTAPARPARAFPPVDPAQLRRAVSQMLPLLAGRDPGARDCLADNRPTFQAAFAPEAYAEFEQCIKKRDFDSAQDQLKKAAKRHGIM